jgi:mono/diheme cytochrome c family protein
MRQLLLFVATALATTWGAWAAEDVGDPQAGFDYAKQVCSVCHAISAEQSPNPKAPRFREVADTQGKPEPRSECGWRPRIRPCQTSSSRKTTC